MDCFISNDKLYKYNFKDYCNCLANLHVSTDFCALEFVYHIIKESGITDCGKPRNLVRPQDLYNINGNIIYKGNLRDYKILDDVWKEWQ